MKQRSCVYQPALPVGVVWSPRPPWVAVGIPCVRRAALWPRERDTYLLFTITPAAARAALVIMSDTWTVPLGLSRRENWALSLQCHINSQLPPGPPVCLAWQGP